MLSRILRYWAVFCLPLLCEAKIIETVTVETVVPLIDESTWLLVDLDNTMYEGKQALGHTEWFYDKAYALMRETGMTLEEATQKSKPNLELLKYLFELKKNVRHD